VVNCKKYNLAKDNTMQAIRVPLRRLHDYLRLSLPVEFCEANGLHPGDYADIVPDNGEFKLRFVKIKPLHPAEVEPGMMIQGSCI
jgi:hypothetical protein